MTSTLPKIHIACIFLAVIIFQSSGDQTVKLQITVTDGSPATNPIYLQRNGRCYFMNMAKMTSWDEARVHCQYAGFDDLVAIETEEENEMLKTFLLETSAVDVDRRTPYHKFWTSANVSGSGYIWQSTLSSVTVNDWASGSGNTGNNILMAIADGFKWRSKMGSVPAFPLCEKRGCSITCLNGGVCRCNDVCTCPATHTGRMCARKRICSLQCPIRDSVPDADCLYCICPAVTIKGPTIIDSNKNNLEGVEVSASADPTQLQAVTGKDGSWSITGLCYGSEVFLWKSGFDKKELLLEKDSLADELVLLKLPKIVSGPSNTVIEAGQYMSLCCKTSGNVNKVEWFHNNELFRKGIYMKSKGYWILLVRLAVPFTGTFKCVALGETSTATSPEANVNTIPLSATCKKPTKKLVKIPPKCVSSPRSNTFDTKTCRTQMCPTASCSLKKPPRCCVPKTYSSITLDCKDYKFPAISVSECECGSCDSALAGHVITVRGTITTIIGNRAMKNANVRVLDSSKVVGTDESGAFILDVRVKINRRFVIQVEDSEQTKRFALHTRVLRFSVDQPPKEITINIKVAEIHYQKLEPSSYYMPILGRNAMVMFRVSNATTYVNAAGHAYDGDVVTSIELLDGRRRDRITESPGEFIVSRGSNQNIVKFQAVFSVTNWKSVDDELVRVQPSDSQSIGVYVNERYVKKSFGTRILNGLYSLDMRTGYWNLVGNSGHPGTKQKDMVYVGHFITSVSRNWFAIGILEFGPVCHAKVITYPGKPINREEQNSGALIDITTSIVSVGADKLFIRSHSYLTNSKHTVCVPVACSSKIEKIQAWWSGTLAKPADISETSISVKEQSRLGITVNVKNRYYQLTKPLSGPRVGYGPITFSQPLDQCEQSSSDSGHFVFYTGETYPYEMTIRPTIIATDADRNHFVWYLKPKLNEYKACYIKVRRYGFNSPPEMVVSVMSRGGTHAKVKDHILGVRRDTTNNGIACMEFKCSGIFDPSNDSLSDDTAVEVSIETGNNACIVRSVSPILIRAQKSIGPTVPPLVINKKHITIYMKKEMSIIEAAVVFVGISGIDVDDAKNIARDTCLKSGSNTKVAVTFACS